MDYELMMNGNVKLGQIAPEFEADTTYGRINLSDYRRKWVVLFSYTGDFTPVSTTEIIAFSKMYKYFQEANTELIGLSINSNASHLAWTYDIYKRTGITVPFPLIADRSGEIARKYGMISQEICSTETTRNVVIIDDKGVIKTILMYPLNVGRFIPEILRSIKAIQMAECTQNATPVNWMPGEPVMLKNPKTYEELIKRTEHVENNGAFSWYLTFCNPQMRCIEE